MNRGPVDYESTALPTELPRLGVIHSSIARKKLSNAAMKYGERKTYCVNGYMSQPMPIATTRKATNAHTIYCTRSDVSRLDRNAKVTDTTSAKKVNA